MTDAPPIPFCPKCGAEAERRRTRYGLRDACCGLHGWDGKPLVSPAVHAARRHCHAVVDPLWQTAETAYEIAEPPGTPARDEAVRRIRKAARGRTYAFIAVRLGIPEPEAHMAEQTDIEILRGIWRVANAATPALIRAWAKERREDAA